MIFYIDDPLPRSCQACRSKAKEEKGVKGKENMKAESFVTQEIKVCQQKVLFKRIILSLVPQGETKLYVDVLNVGYCGTN